MKRGQRCTAIAASGLRCARWCAAGETLCGKHLPNATPAGVAQPMPLTPEEILERLMRDSDPSIRLRAVSEYFDQKHKVACPVCAERKLDDENKEAFLRAMTDAEHQSLRDALD